MPKNIMTHLNDEEYDDFLSLGKYFLEDQKIKSDSDYAIARKCILDAIKRFKKR